MQNRILTSVFIRLRSGLLARAQHILGNDADSEDALQDAFCRLWSSKREIESTAEAEALSYTAVRNASIDIARRQRTKATDSAEEIPDILEEAEESDDIYRDVRNLIEKTLSQREKEILYMRDLDGCEFSEIAETYNISEANARMILSRARKTVRDLYRKQK